MSTIVEIDEPAGSSRQPMLLDLQHRGRQAGLAGGVLEIAQRDGILGVVVGAGQMQMAAGARSPSTRDQPVMDGIELIGAARR